MIYVTGDTHCPIDISRLNSKNFNDRNLTKNDYVIICGDAGFVWEGSDNEDLWWQKWIANKNFTTLFVDGNHENHNKLDNLPVEIWNGGKVHKVNDSLIHLMRGQIFTLCGLKFFTMGGAKSTDKMYRKENKTWWVRELPSPQEYSEALCNLNTHNWKVDYVITHTAPDNIQDELCHWYEHDQLTNFLFVIDKSLEFKHWYFGHFHDDRVIDKKHTLVYSEIIKVMSD